MGAILTILALLGLTGPVRAAIPEGAAEVTATIGGTPFTLDTWRPQGCRITGILLVFHGVGRNADGYRDHAEPLARATCQVIVAPLFDEKRFPNWKYQMGGVRHDGAAIPAEAWTIGLVPGFAAWARQALGQPDLRYTVIGHSAGAQFIDRFAAYLPNDATRIVIANPSTWVLPSLETPAPYGFGGFGTPAEAEAALRRYLAAPVIVLLGDQDVLSKDLAVDAAAMAQGPTRLARGQAAFRQAQEAAARRGWPFNWRLMMVPGVGHDATRMFASAQALAALRPQ